MRGFGRYAVDEHGHLVNPRFLKGLRDSQFPPILVPDWYEQKQAEKKEKETP